MFRLPVSGLEFVVTPPTGREELMLLEAGQLDTRLALQLLQRLARSLAEADCDPGSLVVTDYQCLMLRLHGIVFGDAIQASTRCNIGKCHAQVDISFGIGEYLTHCRLAVPKGVEGAEEPGWFRWNGEVRRYRLPTAWDLVEVTGRHGAERELMRRCIQPIGSDGAWLRRVERAMEMQAPSLSGEIGGVCPECNARLLFFFDVERYVLLELRQQAAFVYQDTHLLAKHYHWPESRILAMPRNRRMHYAELLRGVA